ncbi:MULTISPECIES: hypothetical protein [unclassified Lentimicrobium]|uniref:hypothetical protein n=1 Tax=unclassified Lentimicrobium TaxID=2677434 RepID=UPI00155391BD|nr:MULTISPECIES: hypothetical protein [unclassified Lentimicrobium]NPD44393.1 hypothetical protein [Lentimicrobium sp. S6]NPD84341.1 hypothetical protein [Lentimicrobium sp. L6]
MDIESVLIFSVIIAAVFLNFTMTHFRKASWFPYSTRWIISIALSMIGLIGFIFFRHKSLEEVWASTILFSPLILTIIDSFFRHLSFKYQDREWQFYTSLDSAFPQNESEYSLWDIVFTILSLFLIFIMILLSYYIADLNSLYYIENAPK